MRKIILLSFTLLLLVALVFGAFQLKQILDEQDRERQIEQLQDRMDKLYHNDTVRKQTDKNGSQHFTAYYPQTDNKQDIAAVKEIINADIKAISDKNTSSSKLTDLRFYRTEQAETSLSGVKRVEIKRADYKLSDRKIKKAAEVTIQALLLKSDYQVFSLDQLFKDADQAKQIILDEWKNHLRSTDLDDSKIESLMGQKREQSLQEWDFQYETGKLLLPYDQEGQISTFELGIDKFYDVLDEQFLTGADLQAYKSYQEKKPLKLVALTFDDGPSPTTTPKALDILAKYRAKATFFMLGQHVAGNEGLIKRVQNEGHEIGNHSWSHPQLTAIPLEQAKKQILDTQAALAGVIGQTPKLMRPPYGAINASVQNCVDLSFIMWNVDSLDWKSRNTAAIMEQIKKQTQPGSIILMHDIHQTSIDALPSVIQYLQSNGYTLVTVSELLEHQIQAHQIYYGQKP